jgi:hypothetical protein
VEGEVSQDGRYIPFLVGGIFQGLIH